MKLYDLAFSTLLAVQMATGQAEPQGEQPVETLGARDVATEFQLPASRDDSKDQLQKAVERMQVLVRARALGLDRQSATKAWASAETAFRNARRASQSSTKSAAPSFFSGTLASELNVLLARPSLSVIRVTSSQLTLDEPLLLSRADVTLDLGMAELRQASPMPYMVRIEQTRNVNLRGGIFLKGEWGVLVASSQHVEVRGVNLHDLDGGGILVTNSEDAVISRSMFHGLHGAAIMLHGDTHGVVAMDNEIREDLGSSNWDAGVVLTDRNADLAADPDNLRDESHYWVREEAIPKRLHGPQNNVIAYNTITGNASSGIYSDGSTKNVFVGNRIERNSKEGACLDNGSSADVLAFNSFRANGNRWGKSDRELKLDFVAQLGRLADGTSPAKLPAISIDNAAYNLILLNDLDGNFGGGIKLVRTAFYNTIGLNTLIDNNRGQSSKYHFFGIEAGFAGADAPSAELDFAPSRGNQIFGNAIRGTHYAGIFFAAGSDQNDVFDNSIFGATNWAMESAVAQQNMSLNNLTNQKLRNMSSGIDPALLLLGIGVYDSGSVPVVVPIARMPLTLP